jgi:hypothetical protein
MFAVAAGVAAYAGYRWLQRQLERLDEGRRDATGATRADRGAGDPKDLGALEWDEETGAYRPRRHGGERH